MSVDYRNQLAAAVAAVEIIQPTAYRWCGRERKIVPPALAEAMQPNELRSYLVDRLQSELYERFYITGSPKADDNMPWRPPRGDRNAFSELLSDANVGSGARTGGWEVLGDEDNLVILRREELKVWVPPGEILADEWPLVVGTKVRVRLPKELRALSPGFYLALGDDDLDEAESTEPIARIYFDLESSGGSVFIAAVTACSTIWLSLSAPRCSTTRAPTGVATRPYSTCVDPISAASRARLVRSMRRWQST